MTALPDTVAAPGSTQRRFFGVAEAVVVDVKDPAHEGRVRLQLPWFDENMVTDWCRVCQTYAGNGYGAFFVPEERDEVLVAFVHGDVRQPIVLGGLYNGEDKPATFRADDKDQKLIRTKAGHQILLDDTSGEEKIIVVDKSESHRIEISTKDSSITIKSEGGKLSLEADEIQVKANQALNLSGNTLTASAAGEMTLSGSPINLN